MSTKWNGGFSLLEAHSGGSESNVYRRTERTLKPERNHAADQSLANKVTSVSRKHLSIITLVVCVCVYRKPLADYNPKQVRLTKKKIGRSVGGCCIFSSSSFLTNPSTWKTASNRDGVTSPTSVKALRKVSWSRRPESGAPCECSLTSLVHSILGESRRVAPTFSHANFFEAQ